MVVRNVQSRNGVTWNRAKLLWSGRKLTAKVENNLSLSLCAVPQSIVMCVMRALRRKKFPMHSNT